MILKAPSCVADRHACWCYRHLKCGGTLQHLLFSCYKPARAPFGLALQLYYFSFLVGVKTACFNHMWLWLARQTKSEEKRVAMLASSALERWVYKQWATRKRRCKFEWWKSFILVGDLVCIRVLLGNRGYVCQGINRDSITWMIITLGYMATKSLIIMIF